MFNSLEEKNSHPYDKFIERDDEHHIYSVRGNPNYISVTTLINNAFEKFDSNKIINDILKRNKGKYYNMNKKEILFQWSESTRLGTLLHANIENYWNKKDTVDLDQISIEYKYFLNFVNDFPIQPYRTEWMIFTEKKNIAGAIDFIAKKSNGRYILFDWKRSCNINVDKNYGKFCLKKGLETILDTNYYHYCLQLNTYRYILESEYNIMIDEMYLVSFHPDNDNYLLYEIPRMEAETEILLG